MNIVDTDWKNTLAVLQEYGEKVRDQYRSNLEMNRHNASGNLSKNIEVIVYNGPDKLEVDLQLEDYWKWVEEGRKKGGMPPVKKIEEWIVAKRIVPRVDDFGKVPTVQQLSWAIAKSIEKNGYPAVGHPLQNAIDSVALDFENAIAEAIAKDISVTVDKALEYLII